MKKIERVYREILYQVLEHKNWEFTQKSLSKRCNISIGNVNYALNTLERMNSIEKKPRKFIVLDVKKILIYWASLRKIENDIIYQTHSDENIRTIENMMPPCLFTSYSAFKHRYGEPPAGYSEVYVYSKTLKLIKERFPLKQGKNNVFVLKTDFHLEKFKEVPIAQMYVDLWNMGTWYAQEFIRSLGGIIDGILE